MGWFRHSIITPGSHSISALKGLNDLGQYILWRPNNFLHGVGFVVNSRDYHSRKQLEMPANGVGFQANAISNSVSVGSDINESGDIVWNYNHSASLTKRLLFRRSRETSFDSLSAPSGFQVLGTNSKYAFINNSGLIADTATSLDM